MNKLKPKPLDIINAAIAEIYGEQAVKLLALVSTLNTKGMDIVLSFAYDYSMIPHYTKAINLGERLTDQKTQVNTADSLTETAESNK